MTTVPEPRWAAGIRAIMDRPALHGDVKANPPPLQTMRIWARVIASVLAPGGELARCRRVGEIAVCSGTPWAEKWDEK